MEEQRNAIIRDLSDEFMNMKNKVCQNEHRIDDLDNYSRRNNVVFHGVPRIESENPIDLAVKLGAIVGVIIEPRDIDIAHRLPSKNTKLPPPFIIRFVNRWKREEVMEAAKIAKPTAECMGGGRDMKIYCNDHLTSKCQALLLYAKRLRPEYHVWTKRGAVMCRSKNEGALPEQITCNEDVDFLQQEKSNTGGLRLSQKRSRESTGSGYSPTNDQYQTPKKSLVNKANTATGSNCAATNRN